MIPRRPEPVQCVWIVPSRLRAYWSEMSCWRPILRRSLRTAGCKSALVSNLDPTCPGSVSFLVLTSDMLKVTTLSRDLAFYSRLAIALWRGRIQERWQGSKIYISLNQNDMIMLRKMVGNFILVPLWRQRQQMQVCQRVSFKIVAANDQSLKYGQRWP